ncbi:flagellar assembly protein A [Dechloromonas sp. ZY10]|uniref:flagellar assembly protein A n=1 Tax=Dechloromonas aquae TaxID=2664436 RepID=UPI003527ED0E
MSGEQKQIAGGGFPLPGFIVSGPQGIAVELAALDSLALFPEFVQSLFASGNYLVGLDYPLFQNLLFHWSLDDIAAELERREQVGEPSTVFLAKAVTLFLPERKALYRGLKIDSEGREAEYLFEPLFIEREEQEAVFGPPDEHGDPTILEYRSKTLSEPARLELDELVAAVWLGGLRLGIDLDQVRSAILAAGTQWQVIARQQAPQPGHDASLEEASSTLHRDNTPKIRPDGRLDLCQYANRFPQVFCDDVLFRKLPKQEGLPGRDVRGRLLAPEPVKDFDLHALAGEGVRLEAREGQQCLLADRDGFVDIEPQSGKISVIEKIVNREGVSSRTTGNLALSGDEYEEHGEVQEKRRVEGLHMTFLAPVYGHVVSRGGRISLKSNLGGGVAESPQGTIVIEGGASNARIDAHGGEVIVKRAESCTIFAARVQAEHLVGCTVVADAAEVGVLEGGALACKLATIGCSSDRRGVPALVNLRLPDPGPLQARESAVQQALAETEQGIAGRQEVLRELREQRDMKTYFSLHARIKSGEQVLSQPQLAQWNALVAKVSPLLRVAQKITGEIQGLRQQLETLGNERDAVEKARSEAGLGVACAISEVQGETEVRAWRYPATAKAPHLLPAKELQTAMTTACVAVDRLFSDDHGQFHWP